MFVGRENELTELQSELKDWKSKTAVLVYGKRRVGKSTLINRAADSFDGVVINQKTFDTRILEALGNGKKKYTEIRDWLKSEENGLLDKQLKILLDMETIRKKEPINRRNDKKKQFYEIEDNLER